MNGIENIKTVIFEEARVAAAKITEEAQQKATQLVFDGQIEAKKYQQGQELLIEKECAELIEKAKVQGRLNISRGVLAQKQSLITQAFDSAKQRILAIEGQEYVALLADLIAKNAPQGGEIAMNQADLDAYGQSVLVKVGSGYTLCPTAAVMPRGAVVRMGKIDINCCIEAIIANLSDTHAQSVMEILFRG